MSNFIASREGNSEFIKSKLEQEYVPKVIIRKNLFFGHQTPSNQRHVYLFKEEKEICKKAIQSIKNKQRLRIDWNTRTNFKITQSLPNISQKSPLEHVSVPIRNNKIRLQQLLGIYPKKQIKFTRSKTEQNQKVMPMPLRKRKRYSILQVQQQLYKESPLKLLKMQLRNKFNQIRNLVNK